VAKLDETSTFLSRKFKSQETQLENLKQDISNEISSETRNKNLIVFGLTEKIIPHFRTLFLT
jgi:hypothetical protein